MPLSEVKCNEKWNNMYNRLISYKEKYGNCLVPTKYKEDTKLGRWVNTQRQSYKNNILSNDHIDKLKSIDFVFCRQQELDDTWDNAWNDMYGRLILYKEKHGNCLVPDKYKEDKKLGNWVQHQRKSYKNNKLSKHRIDRLTSIGFVFGNNLSSVSSNGKDNSIFSVKWNTMYEQLVLYKQKHGNFLVPRCSDGKDTKLGSWVNTQRMSYRKNMLSKDRVDKLKSIGFVFCRQQELDDELNEKWNNMYDRLILYKERHGNCLVPQQYEEDDNVKLGTWVKLQRRFYKNNKLSNERIDKLNTIGFVFIIKTAEDDETRWDDMFNRLELYKQKHGNCLVPNSYRDNDDTKLGNWFHRQRTAYKNNKLSKERTKKLKSIGFVSSQDNGNSNSRKSKLRNITRNANYNSSDDDVVSDIIVSSTSSTNNSSTSSNETVTETSTVRPISRRLRQRKVINYNEGMDSDEEFDIVTGPAELHQQKEILEDEEMVDENNFLHNEEFRFTANENNTMLSDLNPVLPATAVMTDTIKNETTTTTTATSNIAKEEKEGKEIIVADEYFYDESRCALPISNIITGNKTSSVNSDGDNSSLFADAEEHEEEFVVSATSSFTTSDTNSCRLSSVSSNRKTTICDGNDSIFADAEEEEDISWGLFK